jgi:hypothetical protein
MASCGAFSGKVQILGFEPSYGPLWFFLKVFCWFSGRSRPLATGKKLLKMDCTALRHTQTRSAAFNPRRCLGYDIIEFGYHALEEWSNGA